MGVDRKASVLCVDDEQNVLDGLERTLRKRYSVRTAQGGEAGLEAVRSAGPFEVVISDMQMPGMNGAEFLGRVLQIDPDTSRILLTGRADVDAAIDAVNEGRIFRFLRKPCPPDVLHAAVEAAVFQYRVVTAERVLLNETLHGSIRTLTNILALTNPQAFGRASRAKTLAGRMASELHIENRWQVEVAAMLSQIGSVAIPSRITRKMYGGEALTESEREMAARMPLTAEKLLADIPRMEPVQDILRYQAKNFDGSGTPSDPIVGKALPVGSRILRLVLAYADLEAKGVSGPRAAKALGKTSGKFDPELFPALDRVVHRLEAETEVRELLFHEITPGMEFAQDVESATGEVLVGRGQEATAILYERFRNFSQDRQLSRRIRMIVPVSAPQPVGSAE